MALQDLESLHSICCVDLGAGHLVHLCMVAMESLPETLQRNRESAEWTIRGGDVHIFRAAGCSASAVAAVRCSRPSAVQPGVEAGIPATGARPANVHCAATVGPCHFICIRRQG